MSLGTGDPMRMYPSFPFAVLRHDLGIQDVDRRIASDRVRNFERLGEMTLIEYQPAVVREILFARKSVERLYLTGFAPLVEDLKRANKLRVINFKPFDVDGWTEPLDAERCP